MMYIYWKYSICEEEEMRERKGRKRRGKALALATAVGDDQRQWWLVGSKNNVEDRGGNHLNIYLLFLICFTFLLSANSNDH